MIFLKMEDHVLDHIHFIQLLLEKIVSKMTCNKGPVLDEISCI